MDNTVFLVWLVLALVGVVTLLDWRKGVLLVLLVGFIQDPLRKLTPNEPVYLSVLVGVFLGLALLSALLQQRNLTLAPLYAWYARLRTPLNLFIALVLLQALVTLVKYGNPVLAGLGMLAYLGPLPAMMLVYHYAARTSAIGQWLQVYTAYAVLMAASVYFAYYSGLDIPLFDQVGVGVIVYAEGGILESFQGIMRSAEISAWHAGTAACLLIILYVARGRWLANAWMILLVLALIGVILLSGRRKMLFELAMFIGFYGVLLAYFRRGAGRLALLVAGLTGLLFWLLSEWIADAELARYVARGATTFGDAPDRLELTGWQAIQWSINQHGWLGGGAGIASQGGQHFGGGVQLGGGGAEGGIGKIVAELGVPALFLLAWLGWELGRSIWRILDYARQLDPQLALYVMGLVALLAANLPVYIVATQIYGDLFVLILLGSCLGMVLATPKIIALRQKQLRQQTAMHVPQTPSLVTPVG